MKKLVKGNEAAVIGSLVAGCDAYFGYPITPASEIAHAAAEYYLKLGKIFIQAESEIAAINMVLGAASAGKRAMTASSGPGISLKQECVSFLAGSEMPCVIVDIMRAGPGLGNIGPEQSDYFQVVKGGGHGSYRVIVLAPNSVREMYEMTIRAFDLADRYRNPVYVLADATIGQMMEPIDVEHIPVPLVEKPWRLDTTAATNGNLFTSIFLDFDELGEHVGRLTEKYNTIETEVSGAELYRVEDADVVLTGYGIVSRLLRTTVDILRDEGIRAGLLRPTTLWPFPTSTFRASVRADARVLVVELSTGQYVEDVRLSLPRHDVSFMGRLGGRLPESGEIAAHVRSLLAGEVS